MERRHFIAAIGAAVIGTALPYSLYRYLEGGLDEQEVGVRNYLNAGPNAALDLITSNDDFYVTTSRNTPAVDPKTWSLSIDGLVEQPLHFNYGEMRAESCPLPRTVPPPRLQPILMAGGHTLNPARAAFNPSLPILRFRD